MKKLITLSAVLALLCTLSCQKHTTSEPDWSKRYHEQNTQPKEPGQIKVMTFNIRGHNDNDGAFNHWAVRAEAVKTAVEVQKPAILGWQEITEKQWPYLEATLLPFGYAALGDIDQKNAVMYNPAVIEVEDHGLYWLTDHPDIKSDSWDGYLRYVRWAKMRIKGTEKRFFYMNTHLGLTADSRLKALALIIKRIPMYNTEDLPIVLMGDFNTRPDDSVFTELKKTMTSTREIAPITDDVATYNAWGNIAKEYICDYIFTSIDKIECSEYRTVTIPYEGHTYVSDHFPVYAIIKF